MKKIENYLNLPPEKRDSGLLMRDIVLPDIFNDDKNKILYYYGKDLANNFDFPQIEEIMAIFEKIGFGQITLEKVKKDIYLFQVLGKSVDQRFLVSQKPEFALETGFLAQAITIAIQRPAEGQFKLDPKKKAVSFLIQTIPQ
ncbi:DUF2507 domain-containing protein [Xylocopilactobacillus apicola]|uniref:DUF2507 domain-containing protein n=1 Tax=Xylocopilactobacillus apicola TaxID=2932184 RepID=A0AAU9D8W3_9LACO|nr:DUF2507 domain-containing protein [Xylocopilactobacillus apicola]BDR58790.1 hypothetical protein XA3_12310 [Xylocopilactobacillus apicola]